MKGYININQKSFIAIAKLKNIRVDGTDGILFDWIQNFTISGKALKKLIDNKLYIWVSYKAIREDNPLCNINTNDIVGRRLNKLIDLGLLEKFLSKDDGSKAFFHITKFAFTYLLEGSDLPTQKSEPLPTQKSYNSKLNNRELIESKKTLVKELLKSESIEDNLIILLEDFEEYRREIKKPLKTIRPLKAYLNQLQAIKNKTLDLDRAIKEMKEHEWQTLKIDWLTEYKQKQGKQHNNSNYIQEDQKGEIWA